MFKLDILDKIKESGIRGENVCYLTKGNLQDFIANLPSNFRDYDIQREIVSNIYLDYLVDTVVQKHHIPSIVLVVDKFSFIDEKQIEIMEYKILDGLQRTYRLKIIWDTYKFILNEIRLGKGILDLSMVELSRKYRKELANMNSSALIMNKIIISYKSKYEYNISIFEIEFLNNSQWFELWINLDPKEQIEKMLIANAGHRQVSIRHQLELLFLHILADLKMIKGHNGIDLKIIREKEMSSIRFSKLREKGWFHFSHIISSVISFVKGTPVTTNADLVMEMQPDRQRLLHEEYDFNNYFSYFDYSFLDKTISFLTDFDEHLEKHYGDEGVKWIGKEGVLIGIFASLGRFQKEKKLSEVGEPFSLFINILEDNPGVLNISEYNEHKANINLSKVNIGSQTKQAVRLGIDSIINNSEKPRSIDWEPCFGGK